jgi:hypothetical protein
VIPLADGWSLIAAEPVLRSRAAQPHNFDTVRHHGDVAGASGNGMVFRSAHCIVLLQQDMN